MKRTLLILLTLVSSLVISAQNLVVNPQFEMMLPSTECYNPSMHCYQKDCPAMENLFRKSPAKNWTLWLGTYQNYACVAAELVKAASNCVPPYPNYVMNNMMHIKTTVGGSGIVNSDVPAGTAKVKVTCWVYVIKGKVQMSYGPTGVGLVSVFSTSNCKWEQLVVYKKDARAANQITVYAADKDAEWYMDAVSVVKL